MRIVEFHLVHTSKHKEPLQGTLVTLAQVSNNADLAGELLIYLIAHRML